MPAATIHPSLPARIGEPTVGSAVASSAVPLGQLPPPTYRGRVALRDVVARWARDVAAGAGGLVVVEGVAGLGKSRLLAEVGADPVLADVARLTGVADRFDADRPFGLWRDLLDVRRDRELRDALARVEASAAAGDAAGDEVRYRIQDLVLDRIDDLVQRGPLLVLADDLQWADPASVLALAVVARRATADGIGLVLAMRPQPRRPELAHLVEQAVRTGAVHADLDPLDPDEVRAIAAEVASWTRPDGDVSPGASPTLGSDDLARIGGNPYLAVVLGGWGRSSVLDRLAVHDGATLAVLRAAAVFGRGATPEVVAAVADVDVATATDLLQRLVSDGILADRSGRAFHHELVRDVVLDEIDEPGRRALERRAVDALLASGAGPVAVRRHVLAATGPGTPCSVDDAALLRAAAAALRSSSPIEAADLLVAADGLLAPDGPDRDEVLLERVEAELRVGRLADAAAGAATGLERAAGDGADDRRRRVAFHRLAAEALQLDANRVGALPHLRAALAIETGPTRCRAALLASLAATQLWTIDVAGAEASATEAIALGDELGDAAAAAGGWLVQCRLAALRGDVAHSLACGDRALALGAADPAVLRQAPGVYVGLALLNGDRPDDAIGLLQRGARACEEAGLPAEEGQHQGILALVGWMAGRWDVARVAGAAARAISADLGSRAGMPTVEASLGWIAFLAGELDAARAAVAQARDDLALPGADGGGLPYVLWLEARLAEHDGDLDAAASVLGSVWELAHEVVPAATVWFAPDLARLRLAVGDQPGAAAVAALAVTLAPLVDTPTARGVAAWCTALVDDDPIAAVDALAHLAAAPRPHRSVDAALDLAPLLARHGCSDEAAEALRTAGVTAVDLGATLLAQRVVEAQVALGGEVTGDRRPTLDAAGTAAAGAFTTMPTIWDQVTPAEREVALLVAEGLSNPRIAERLYVSRRTVESHVSALLRKLAVPNRVALAALVIQADAGP